MKHFILSIFLFQFFQFFSNAQFSIAENQLQIPLHINASTALNNYNEHLFSTNYIEKPIILNTALFLPKNKKTRSGFGRGAWIGGLAGILAGGIIGAATYKEPEPYYTISTCGGWCYTARDYPISKEGRVLVSSFIGAASGFILGGITGVIIKRTKKK